MQGNYIIFTYINKYFIEEKSTKTKFKREIFKEAKNSIKIEEILRNQSMIK